MWVGRDAGGGTPLADVGLIDDALSGQHMLDQARRRKHLIQRVRDTVPAQVDLSCQPRHDRRTHHLDALSRPSLLAAPVPLSILHLVDKTTMHHDRIFHRGSRTPHDWSFGERILSHPYGGAEVSPLCNHAQDTIGWATCQQVLSEQGW